MSANAFINPKLLGKKGIFEFKFFDIRFYNNLKRYLQLQFQKQFMLLEINFQKVQAMLQEMYFFWF
ncbi:unnamed protein product [Paramecium sonneborni]|uniref:Uncharacterized protein n=1 Tax=Paramecium sonneborni TaxID=65129 RepID=A0A8S1RIY4_9CILI|nr:unnamed protein product [Paramecium sonneborni]CAD8128482.1 unnamed protein product [Paramecium sonneborni]